MRVRRDEVNVVQELRVPRRNVWVRFYLWACERLYHELARQYDFVSWLVSFGQWRRWQRFAWKYIDGKKILEVGSGTGAILVEGDLRGVEITGVEKSPQMGAVALERLRKAGGVVPLIIGDARWLPLPDHHFESVLATFPADYIFELQTLRELRRVLCVGGRVVIVGVWIEVHIGPLQRFIPVLYGRPKEEALEVIHYRLREAGFEGKWHREQRGLSSVGVLVAHRV